MSGTPPSVLLGDEVVFPSGKRAQNRFAKVRQFPGINNVEGGGSKCILFKKSSLYEALADWGGGVPNDELVGLYRLWAQGNWGIILTGTSTSLLDAVSTPPANTFETPYLTCPTYISRQCASVE